MSTPNKMQKAGRTFLLRLIAEQGLPEAVNTLRSLADELEWLGKEEAVGQDRTMMDLGTGK